MSKKHAIELLTQLKKDTIYDVLYGNGRDEHIEKMDSNPQNADIDNFCESHGIEYQEFMDALCNSIISTDILENVVLKLPIIIIDTVYIDTVYTLIGYDTMEVLNKLTTNELLEVSNLLDLDLSIDEEIATVKIEKTLVAHTTKEALENSL